MTRAKRFKKTEKYKQALRILCSERYLDTDEETLHKWLVKNKLTHEVVYSSLKKLGFYWTIGKQWKMVYPLWMETFIYEEELE